MFRCYNFNLLLIFPIKYFPADVNKRDRAVIVTQPKRFHWNVSGECRIQLVETVPATLISHNFAEQLPVEHMTTMEVKTFQSIQLFHFLFHIV